MHWGRIAPSKCLKGASLGTFQKRKGAWLFFWGFSNIRNTHTGKFKTNLFVGGNLFRKYENKRKIRHTHTGKFKTNLGVGGNLSRRFLSQQMQFHNIFFHIYGISFNSMILGFINYNI